MTLRKIKHLNQLAKKGMVVFRDNENEPVSILDRIVYLREGEDAADEDCFAVFEKGFSYWVGLENCQFFVLTPYK
jgi:hypothetical protein